MLGAAAAPPLVDSALADARIGEQADGYLGFVEPPSPELRKVVADINIRRREAFTERAIVEHVTVAEFAAATACQILRKLPVGRAFRLDNGSWRIRGPGSPILPLACG